ncbi:hypothetical protein cyc_08705 [Cyclospora cayetanensis]|uniref:Bacterial surface antigen (D15) domain-containing protein n=1 Tax=Cyclospora cayetanensis TaxID=88456 RepID=A0A1D3D291_9EIME|nr:hypothetical protein cyc_08705 [Cyclospora cayetanensis]
MRHPEGSSGASPSRPPMASSASGGAQGNKKREPPALELNLDSHVGGISVNLKGLHFVKPETIAPELVDFQEDALVRRSPSLADTARVALPEVYEELQREWLAGCIIAACVRTVRDLLLAVESTQRRLHSLNLFSKTASELHCGQKDGEVCVTLHLKEERRRCNVGVNISGRGETELEASASIPALGGTNKSLTLTAATAPMGGPSRVFSASLFAPRLPGFIQRGAPLFSVGTVRLFSSRKDMTHYNSTALTATGTAAELRAEDAYVIDKDRSVCTPVNDHLGGDAFFASERGFGGYHPRVFVFGSVGGIANVFQHHTQLTQKDAKTVSSRMSSLFRDWRGTVGLGICFPLQRGVWLEGALALPVRRAATDETERLHIGLRVTSIEVPS